jgi:hypothetical protein
MVHCLKHSLHAHLSLYLLLMKTIIFSSIMIFAIAGSAYGHGFGQSFEKVVDNYMIDVGIDALDLVAGEPMRFDFVLWNKDRTETPEFTDAWVRIAPADRGIVFAGNLHQPEFGSTGMTYMFPKAGDYELTVRFQQNGEPIVEASFPLKVSAGASDTSGSWQNSLMGIFIGIIIGSAAVWFLKRKRV